ncbi:MAG: WD40 repeat domain-containing protein [Candidatus Acidiferrales bacterium]
MHHRDRIFLGNLVAAFLLLLPARAAAGGKLGWKVHKLSVDDVKACAFTPDGSEVAFVYLTHYPPGLAKSASELYTYTIHLALWDFRTGRVVEKRQWKYAEKNPQDPWAAGPIYLRFTDGGRRLIYFDVEAIRIFDVPGFKLEKQVPFSWPPGAKYFGTIPWNIAGFSVDADGSRAAVGMASFPARPGGIIRLYDLSTGNVIREWKIGAEATGVYGVAVSANGNRVAASWTPLSPSSDPERFIPPDMGNVRVMEVATGRVLTTMSTNYYAGPVLFGPNDTLLTGSINPDLRGYKYDSVKVWDARTGKLLREITNPRVGVHYRLSLSPDGKLLLGYIGTEKARENFVDISSEQFEIWDFATGKAVATSPEIPPLFKTAPHFGDFPPSLELSPDGRYVLLSWDGFAKPIVYEIPQP